MDDLKTALEGFKKEVLANQKETQDLSDEKFNKLEKSLDEKIQKSLDDQAKKRKLSMPGLEEEKKTFHLSKCIDAQLKGEWSKDASFEKSVIEEVAQKSNNGGTGEAGGFLIPDEVTNEVIDLAIAATPIKELGVTIMKGLRGELPIPKVTGRQTGYWVGEEEAATETQASFGEIVLRPKTLAAFTKISRRVIHQTSGLAEKIVRQELANAMRLKLEQAIINGSGSEKEPKGIVKYDGLTSTAALGANGARFKVDNATDMVTAIDEADMLKPTGKYGFLMRPTVKQGLATERVIQYSGQAAADGMPVINPFMTNAQIEEMLGYKVRTTTLIPNDLVKGSASDCSNVIFGDWSQVLMGMWEGFELKASDTAGNSGGSAMLQRQIWLTAFQGVDIQIKDETGMTVISDAISTKANW